MHSINCFEFNLYNLAMRFFFQLLPHQFGVVVKGGCEVLVHGIQAVLDVHLD
jgi:hypothetical protein